MTDRPKTLAELVANTVGQWRQTGQTTMLCDAARAYHGLTQEDVCVVTATEKEADQVRRDHGVAAGNVGVTAKSVQALEYFRGRRGVLFLLDNHVLLQLGDEHHDLARRIKALECDVRWMGTANDTLADHNAELRAELDRAKARLARLQTTRSRRARRRRKRRSHGR